MKLGLRFRRGDARVLEALADRVRRGEIQGDVGTFAHAAEAARTGEPLIVECDQPNEVHQMAAVYGALGMRPPAVESLSGD